MPTLSIDQAIILVEKLVAIALLFQSLEFVALRKTFSNSGIWTGELIVQDVQWSPGLFKKFVSVAMNEKVFFSLVLLRLVCAGLLLFFSYSLVLILLLSISVVILIRWRGSFNGGSDYMLLILLLALSAARTFPEDVRFTVGALWYVGLQVCASFFIAGYIKAKRRNWWSGRALQTFVGQSVYQRSFFIHTIEKHSGLAKLLSWAVIVFECSFPLALLQPSLGLVFISVALLFQIGNIYFFGLNRFFWTWAAGFPALYYCSQ